MKRLCSILFLSLSLMGPKMLEAQRYEPPEPAPAEDLPTHNAAYIELLGSGGTYSLNYERSILIGPPFSFRGRIGISFFGGGFTFPLYLQLSHPFLGPIEMEWGGGTTLIPDIQAGKVTPQWGGVAGFRYSNTAGLLLRLGYTPFFRFGDRSEGEKGIRHWGGFSVGLRF